MVMLDGMSDQFVVTHVVPVGLCSDTRLALLIRVSTVGLQGLQWREHAASRAAKASGRSER